MINREQLAAEYRDWFNNYLTVEIFAEHRGLTVKEAESLLEAARSCQHNPHPDS